MPNTRTRFDLLVLQESLIRRSLVRTEDLRARLSLVAATPEQGFHRGPYLTVGSFPVFPRERCVRLIEVTQGYTKTMTFQALSDAFNIQH